MSDPSDLGPLLFVCDKYPAKVCFKTHCGGWGQIAVQLLLFGTLIALFPAGLLLAGLEKILGDKFPLNRQALAIGLIFGMTLVVDVLFVLYFRRCYHYARMLEIALHQNGIVITRPSSTVCKRYDEIRDVYFGARSELLSGSMSIGKYLNRGIRMGEAGLRQRLTFKFTDGSVIRFLMCFSYFPEEAIAKLLNQIASQRPDLFAAK